MEIQVISDLHLDVDPQRQYPVQADTLVIAGDLGPLRLAEFFFHSVCKQWDRVIMVLGNHEYGFQPKNSIHNFMHRMCLRHDNLTWLDNRSAIIGGTHFFGGTLWYPFKEESVPFERYMWDHRYIPNLHNWIHDSNKDFRARYGQEVNENTAVISHHLPCYKSVAQQYATSVLMDFFVSDEEEAIVDKKPKLWIHGHTHSSVDYRFFDTRIICNPKGYAGENGGFSPGLVVEV